jgi:hypothetical protein
VPFLSSHLVVGPTCHSFPLLSLTTHQGPLVGSTFPSQRDRPCLLYSSRSSFAASLAPLARNRRRHLASARRLGSAPAAKDRDPERPMSTETLRRAQRRATRAKDPTTEQTCTEDRPSSPRRDRPFLLVVNGASKQSLLPPPLLPLPIDDRLEVDRRPISSPWHPLIFPLSLYKLVTDLSPSHNRAPFLPQVLPRSSHSHPALWTTPDCLAGISPVSTPPRWS